MTHQGSFSGAEGGLLFPPCQSLAQPHPKECTVVPSPLCSPKISVSVILSPLSTIETLLVQIKNLYTITNFKRV